MSVHLVCGMANGVFLAVTHQCLELGLKMTATGGSGQDWSKDNAPLLAAAISYYTLFSLVPLLIIAIAVVGTVFGHYAVQNEIGTTYGAAASLVIILIWTYYSAQIVLYGAEFTKGCAHYFGSRIVPAKID